MTLVRLTFRIEDVPFLKPLLVLMHDITYCVSLTSGVHFEATETRRYRSCWLQPVWSGDSSRSRLHCRSIDNDTCRQVHGVRDQHFDHAFSIPASRHIWY